MSPVARAVGAARAALASRSPGEAAQRLRDALAEQPDHREALELIGYVLYLLGRSAEAEPYCRRAVEHHPESAYAWKGLGMHLLALGAHDEGFAALQKACALAPNWLDPHWDYLVMCQQVGARQRFEQALRMAVERFPAEEARLTGLASGAPWSRR